MKTRLTKVVVRKSGNKVYCGRAWFGKLVNPERALKCGTRITPVIEPKQRYLKLTNLK